MLEAEAEGRRNLQFLLSEQGCDVAACDGLDAAARELGARVYDGVVCPAVLTGRVLDAMGHAQPQPLIIAVARDAAVGLEALDQGAFDCLVTPVVPAALAMTLRRASRFEQVRRTGIRGTSVPPAGDAAAGSLAGMVGTSAAIRSLFQTIERIAQHKASVLIQGESGTGKELVARAIHDLGPRSRKRFVAINCGAIPANLLESELFGHRRGAFTDAVRDKPGLFEAADGGTLFLDEIGELPLNLQVKLLRAIQEEEIRRIGDTAITKVDVRIIAATLRDLSSDVVQGRFREDLFYRLNVVPVTLPPLRERRDDIRPLVEHFIRRCAVKHGSPVERVSDEAMALLESYAWPGNIRELENTIERAMVLCDSPVIDVHLLEDKLQRRPERAQPEDVDATDLSIKKAIRAIEEKLIRKALATTGGNRTNAAKLLEISHRALLYKIKEYGI